MIHQLGPPKGLRACMAKAIPLMLPPRSVSQSRAASQNAICVIELQRAKWVAQT